MVRFVGLFALAGLLIAVAFSAISPIVENYLMVYALPIGMILFRAQLVLWPSSLMGLAVSQYEHVDVTVLTILGISIVANAVLYSIVGGLIWLGIHKARWILYVTVGLIAVGWLKLLTL